MILLYILELYILPFNCFIYNTHTHTHTHTQGYSTKSSLAPFKI